MFIVFDGTAYKNIWGLHLTRYTTNYDLYVSSYFNNFLISQALFNTLLPDKLLLSWLVLMSNLF